MQQTLPFIKATDLDYKSLDVHLYFIYNDNYSSGISYRTKLIIGKGLAIVYNAFESINVCSVSDNCYIFKDFSFYLHLVTGLKWHV